MSVTVLNYGTSQNIYSGKWQHEWGRRFYPKGHPVHIRCTCVRWRLLLANNSRVTGIYNMNIYLMSSQGFSSVSCAIFCEKVHSLHFYYSNNDEQLIITVASSTRKENIKACGIDTYLIR